MTQAIRCPFHDSRRFGIIVERRSSYGDRLGDNIFSVACASVAQLQEFAAAEARGSWLRRGAVTGAAWCGPVRLLGRAALANPCGLLRRYWARTQESSQRHPRGIPEAYQRHTRGKPRGKPQRQTLFHAKIYICFAPSACQDKREQFLGLVIFHCTSALYIYFFH